ncbi:MAG: antibiotic biosynthesis monooxygenase [Desulfofustis sp.]|jgi:heme oxygenase (mycobilin-producing)
MAVHVVIKRKFRMNKPDELVPLMQEMNKLARTQPGYIATNILQSREDPDNFMVISTWETEDDWKAWFRNPERRSFQNDIDSLIGERTFYEVFDQVFQH